MQNKGFCDLISIRHDLVDLTKSPLIPFILKLVLILKIWVRTFPTGFKQGLEKGGKRQKLGTLRPMCGKINQV